jgi:tRNA-2-methylthio-N6-dimethylallyladenosine synthase
MNVNDAEIVMSILQKKGYTRTDQPQQANVHLLMTCAIRENAERKIFTRLSQLRAEQVKQDRDFKVGILGKVL